MFTYVCCLFIMCVLFVCLFIMCLYFVSRFIYVCIGLFIMCACVCVVHRFTDHVCVVCMIIYHVCVSVCVCVVHRFTDHVCVVCRFICHACWRPRSVTLVTCMRLWSRLSPCSMLKELKLLGEMAALLLLR